MLYSISSKQPIDWNIQSNIKRILQNIINLLNTFQYELGYARLMGLSRNYLDLPISQSQSLIAAEIVELISRYESRATVKDIKFLGFNAQDETFEIMVVVDI